MVERYQQKGSRTDTVGYAEEEIRALQAISEQLDEMLKIMRPVVVPLVKEVPKIIAKIEKTVKIKSKGVPKKGR